MKRFKNILYVLGNDSDQEEIVAEKVHKLATMNGARICFASTMQESFIEQFGKTLSSRLKELTDIALEQKRKQLELFSQESRWLDLETTHKVLCGKDFIAIIRHVLENEHDLVVKGGSETEGGDGLTMRLFRKCPCPVWIIQKPHSLRFQRVLAAVDAASSHAENSQLNKKIVELASSLAKLENGEAHYVSTWRLDFEGMMRGPHFNMSSAEINEAKEEMREYCHRSMDRIMQSAHISPPPGNVHIIEGETGTVINNCIGKYNIDTLVMGTVARTGVPGLLIGNKAEKILSAVNCTVLAVKPDGFITPIKIHND